MKPKCTQKKDGLSPRDLFQTPNNAIDLLVDFLPGRRIWECACGKGNITRRLESQGFEVISTDIIDYGQGILLNFLSDDEPDTEDILTIVTNPPYSLKKEFVYKAIEYGCPFAFLIPFDMTQWLCDVFMRYDCQAIIPTRRINYIPPNKPVSEAKGAQFHSFWLTRYLNVSGQMTFVELPKEYRK